MKKLLIGLLGFVLLLTACAPQASTDEPQSIIVEPPTSGQSTQPTPTLVRSDLTWEQSILVSQLSETLGISPDVIMVAETEAVTWPDGCLGVVRMGVMCTQAEVPGFRFVLMANGKSYEFHTNKDMTVILPVESAANGSAVEETLILQLAGNLGIKQGDIAVVSNNAVEFPDSCLGVAMENIMCAQMVTPGRIILLEADGVQYEYHTSEDGTRIQPATLALTWKREGGIAGFCDTLTVFLSGEVYGDQCKSQPNGTMGTFSNLLSTSEREQFFQWVADFGQVTLDASDPKGVADGMTNIIVLYGDGTGKPGKPVESEIFTWAQDLFQKLYN